MDWTGGRTEQAQNRAELRTSKESDTQFAKCDKLNEKCENEEESSAPESVREKERDGQKGGWGRGLSTT